MPAKRFSKISENLDKLKEIIALGEKIVAQKFGADKIKKRVDFDTVSVKEFAEYSESKNREARKSDDLLKRNFASEKPLEKCAC